MNFFQNSVPGIPKGNALGARPEHLRVVDTGRTSGKIAHVERLGGDTNVLVTTNEGEKLTVRLFGQHPATVDDLVQLDYNDSDAFQFDDRKLRV